MSTPIENEDGKEVERRFEEHADGLYRFALLRTHDQEIAEDVVQETFLAAMKSKKGFDGRSSIRTWLIGVLKFKIADHYRSTSKLKGSIDFEDAEHSIASQFGGMCWANGHGPKSWGEDPAKLTENNQFLNIKKQCLEDLPERFRDIFTLREIDGEKTQAVGQIF